MEFMKKTLMQVNNQCNTLYDVIYNLFFLAKIKESEDDIAKGKIKFEKKSKEVLKNRKNKIIEKNIHSEVTKIYINAGKKKKIRVFKNLYRKKLSKKIVLKIKRHSYYHYNI